MGPGSMARSSSDRKYDKYIRLVIIGCGQDKIDYISVFRRTLVHLHTLVKYLSAGLTRFARAHLLATCKKLEN